jgi:pimeloyl-ACP methyl ester carboxylesterase
MTMPPQIPAWLHAIYPFAPKTFTTETGARLSYLDEGPRSDEAVLMLHGNPTWSFFYRDIVRTLAPNLRCIVPDHVGMGLSEKPQDYDYSLGSRIADVEALVVSLGLKKLHLIVHDWGGAIGLGFATRHPELIGRMVILNTAAFFSRHIPRRIALCRAGLLGKIIVRGFNGFAGPASWMSTVRPLAPDVKRGFLFPYDSWANRVAVHRFVQDIPMSASHPTRPVLDAIEAKLPLLADREKLILWGGRDFCFNDHFLARWREIFPRAAVHRYADAGHYVLEDAGVDATERISRFLQLNTP